MFLRRLARRLGNVTDHNTTLRYRTNRFFGRRRSFEIPRNVPSTSNDFSRNRLLLVRTQVDHVRGDMNVFNLQGLSFCNRFYLIISQFHIRTSIMGIRRDIINGIYYQCCICPHAMPTITNITHRSETIN